MSTPDLELTREDFGLLITKYTSIMKDSTVEEQKRISDIMLKIKVLVLDNEKSEVAVNTSFNSFTSSNITKVRQLFTDTLSSINDTLAIKISDISYTSAKATIKVEVFPVDSNSNNDPNTVLRADFIAELPRYKRYGFKEEHFLKQFTYNNKVYEFTGFIPKGKTYKYKARILNGTSSYKFSSDIVQYVVGV